MREFTGQSLVKVIDSENIPVINFALPSGRKRRRITFRDAPVHVPFDVGDFRFREDLCHHFIYPVYHFFSGKVQHVLESSVRIPASRYLYDPVQMFTVQVRVPVDHLRLEPEAELHAEILDPLCQSGDTVLQTVRIRDPVAQARVFTAPFSKPSVIEHEQFHAALSGFLRDPHQLVFREVKIRRFPVVDQDRPDPVPPATSCKALLIQPVVRLAQMVQPLIRIYHYRFRRLEFFRRIKLPVKTMGMDAHQHSCGIICIHFHLCQEIAAVYQAESDRFSLEFICCRALQDDERIVVVGRIPPDAAYRLDPLFQPPRLRIPLSCPCPGELDHIIAAVRKIQAETHGRQKMHALLSPVDKTRVSCNDAACGKYSIGKLQMKPGQRISQLDVQRLRLVFTFNVSCRKSGKVRFTFLDPVSAEAEFRDPASVFLKYFHCRHTVVRSAEHTVLLPDVLHGESFVRVIYTGRHRTRIKFQKIRTILRYPDPFSEIDLPQLIVWKYFYYVTDLIIVQMKCILFPVYRYSHRLILLIKKILFALLVSLYRMSRNIKCCDVYKNRTNVSF